MNHSQIRPVFIAGCDRSGTTMLGDMLGAGSGAFATPESQFLHELAPLMHLGAFGTPRAAAAWLTEHFRFATWEMGEPEALQHLIELTNPRATMENLLRHYLQNGGKTTQGSVWVDHTPDNFKHYATLKSLYPDARFIHIVRDGRDVFNSVRDLDWGPNNAYMGTRHWNERLQQALMVEQAEGDNCLRVRYEDLLRDPETELARIAAFAGIPFAPEMIQGGGLVLPGFTRSQHQLVGSRPDPSRIGQWRTQLSGKEVAEFEAYPWSRVLLQQFGYTLATSTPTRVGRLTTLWRYLQDFLLYGLHRMRHRNLERKLLFLDKDTPGMAR